MSYSNFKTASPKKSDGPSKVDNGWNMDPYFDLVSYSRLLQRKCDYLESCLRELHSKTNTLSKSTMSALIYQFIDKLKTYDATNLIPKPVTVAEIIANIIERPDHGEQNNGEIPDAS